MSAKLDRLAAQVWHHAQPLHSENRVRPALDDLVRYAGTLERLIAAYQAAYSTRNPAALRLARKRLTTFPLED